ncbi:unnamed protein product [Adineta steineri]|uniref:Uncharacterized protein n=1 Tax=Adineta steineri TaxID=433720 RepID=A0A818PGZ6_9BILA|nr:unnamed protein product [Adineta steineri]
MKSILIMGANRVLGLGIVNELELLHLAKQHSNVIIPVQIDVNGDKSSYKAKNEAENKLGNSCGLNCLLSNAGVNKNITLNNINEQDMLDTYIQNFIRP